MNLDQNPLSNEAQHNEGSPLDAIFTKRFAKARRDNFTDPTSQAGTRLGSNPLCRHPAIG